MIKFLAMQVKIKRITLDDLPEKYREKVMKYILEN